MQIKKTLTILFTLFFLSACVDGTKQTSGAMVGGLSGALLGSNLGKGSGKLVSVALGTLAGAYIGGSVGQQLDEVDKSMANKTVAYALERAPDNNTSKWHNPNTKNEGTVTITKTQQVSKDTVCREYAQKVYMAGSSEPVNILGKACRNIKDVRGQWYAQT